MQLDPTFAEQFGLMIGAISTLIAAVGGVAIVRGRKETKEGEGPSQLAVLKMATDENTAAINRNAAAVEASVAQINALHGLISDVARNSRDAVGIGRSIEHLLIKLDARRD
ncbi:hypothetical protein [Albirhodobacter sp. R86504]|uniref:hypothetical protein n=1 Tax=Albirhodobacter sp. R86504 TaxID=3093848 RepID=UPI00367045B7